MKWPNIEARREIAREKRKTLANIPRKAFAWLPTETCNGSVVWLQSYWKMYIKGFGDAFEVYYESLEDAERAKK